MKRYDDYVVIIPILNGNILIQRQYKSGARKYCYGFPAGFLKQDESFLDAAKRELFEETGLRGTFTLIGKYYDNTSIGNEQFAIFSVTKVKGKPLSINLDPNETKIHQKWILISELEKIAMPGACMELAKRILLDNISILKNGSQGKQ